jgi:glyoxylase-like metal-dependent hydrolase (beta-lactamase superfamily II)
MRFNRVKEDLTIQIEFLDMEIIEGVYGLPQTLSLGEDHEEKIYPVAIEDDTGLILVDAGLPGNVEKIEDNLAEHGFSLDDVEKLVLTHQDFDHCGCAAELVEETGATVYAHRGDAEAIDGREEPIKGDERYPAVDVDVELSGGEVFHADGREIKIMHTPGHTPGHISLLMEDLLISGDILNVEEDGFSGPRKRFTPDMEEAVEGLNRLSFESFGTVHCFHGGTVEKNSSDVKEIFEQLESEHKGFEKASVDGPARFLRSELENEEVGLSIFQIPSDGSHGAQNDPKKGHRHATETEIYYFREGSGTFKIGDEEVEYGEGDAFLVKPYKLRRIDAETDTEIAVAGAPVGDEAEEGEM